MRYVSPCPYVTTPPLLPIWWVSPTPRAGAHFLVLGTVPTKPVAAPRHDCCACVGNHECRFAGVRRLQNCGPKAHCEEKIGALQSVRFSELTLPFRKATILSIHAYSDATQTRLSPSAVVISIRPAPRDPLPGRGNAATGIAATERPVDRLDATRGPGLP
jgi:hypothetical protein